VSVSRSQNVDSYPAASSGAVDRILDAITRAGGISGQGYETFVMLQRKGKRAVVPYRAPCL